MWLYPQDKPRGWDAWDVEEDYAQRGEEWRGVDSIAILENNSHRVALRVERTWRSSRIVQTYALAANGRRLDIDTFIDWRDRRVLLRRLTPVAVRAERAAFECAFGVVTRPTHRNTSWDEAQFEVAGHRFADLSEPGFGLALLNDAKYGHSARDNVLGLSLVRSPVYPDPLADEGEQRFAYALMPHAGAWHEGGVREEAEDLNQPLLVGLARGLARGDARAARLRRRRRRPRRAQSRRGRRRPDPSRLRARRRPRPLRPAPARRLARRRPGRPAGTAERAEGRRLADPVRSAKLAARAGVKPVVPRGVAQQALDATRCRQPREPDLLGVREARGRGAPTMRRVASALKSPRRHRACHGGGDLLDDRLASRRRRDAQAVMAELVDALA